MSNSINNIIKDSFQFLVQQHLDRNLIGVLSRFYGQDGLFNSKLIIEQGNLRGMGSFVFIDDRVTIRIHEQDVVSHTMSRIMQQRHEKIADEMDLTCTYRGKEYPVVITFDQSSLWFNINCTAFDEIIDLCKPV